MIYEYKPNGVCARQIILDIDGDVVKSVKFIGGCNGNLNGISSLCEGMKISEVIKKLEGIKCGMKPTSCPDQFAQALIEYQQKKD